VPAVLGQQVGEGRAPGAGLSEARDGGGVIVFTLDDGSTLTVGGTEVIERGACLIAIQVDREGVRDLGGAPLARVRGWLMIPEGPADGVTVGETVLLGHGPAVLAAVERTPRGAILRFAQAAPAPEAAPA